ncbi:MAG: GGDEF domain-containing protein [Thiovulaceae bacterium]|nr:GGDEF domain-containing protein [Sulfurimonadaceae bacterium]
MLLPEKKERENRFKLALRMGLPIFFLGLLSIVSFINQPAQNITSSFYIGATLILAIMIYFFLYMIYRGFDERITDPITHIFTREYLYKLLKKEIQKENYSIILVSIDNLHTINEVYGIKNGDNILYGIVKEISTFLSSKGINDFPLGHIKGGDFLIGLDGEKSEYTSIIDLMCLKLSTCNLYGIEVQIIASIADNNFSKNLDYLIDHLFEQQILNKSSKNILKEDDIIDPNDVQISIIDAIKNSNFKIYSQNVYDKDGNIFLEDLSIKLQIENKIIHQNTFIPVVNRLGLSKEFDLVLLDKVAKMASTNERIYSICVSPTTLREPSFVSHMKNLLGTYTSIQNKIVLLISEIDYYNNILRYNQTIQNLRTMGVYIAIDRFGEYHSSFLYFREIEVDMVRFDSRYTKSLSSTRYRDIVKGLHGSINTLHSKSWMKMIEDKEIYEISKELRIDLLQGRYCDNKNFTGEID